MPKLSEVRKDILVTKYGDFYSRQLIGSDKPIKVSVVKHRDEFYIEIRQMYYDKKGELQHGKGCRIPLEWTDDVFESAQSQVYEVLNRRPD